MLRALMERYRDECARGMLSQEGWEMRNVSFALDLDAKGRILNCYPLTDKVQRGKKIVDVPKRLSVPQGKTRTSGIVPFFLCDTASYFWGMVNPEKGVKEEQNAVRRYDESASLHSVLLKHIDSEAAQAICHFFDKGLRGEAMFHAYPCLESYRDAFLAGSNLVFRFQGHYAHDVPAIRMAWENHYAAQEQDAESRLCVVTGKRAPYATLHTPIKGVLGAQSTGAMLVSFNTNAFESYGHDGEQGGNAPISRHAVFAYATALNALLKDASHVQHIGDTTLVYWAQQNAAEAQDLFCSAWGGGNEMRDATLEDVFQKVHEGAAIDFEGLVIPYDNPFYILGIAPNAARLSIRFFLQDSFGAFLDRLSMHFKQMEMVRPPKAFCYPPMWALLQATTNPNATNKMATPIMAGALARAVLMGTPYPTSVYEAILIRIYAEQGDGKITPIRAGFIKAYLIRNKRRKVTVSLDERSTDMAYLLGRWFSILETLQEAANPGVNATIRDRYFDAACSTPAHVFPVLQKLAGHHLRKLDKGLSVYYEQQIGAILGQMEAHVLPMHLPLDEQGMFILGYYHQRQVRFQKKEEK